MHPAFQLTYPADIARESVSDVPCFLIKEHNKVFHPLTLGKDFIASFTILCYDMEYPVSPTRLGFHASTRLTLPVVKITSALLI